MTYHNIVVSALTSMMVAAAAVYPLPVKSLETPVVSNPAPVVVEAPPHVVDTPKAVVHHSSSGDCAKYRELFEKYSWPVETAMQICKDESHGNSDTVGDTNTAHVSCGLMQVRTLAGRPTCSALKDPETNVAYAYEIWSDSGFYPWSTYNP